MVEPEDAVPEDVTTDAPAQTAAPVDDTPSEDAAPVICDPVIGFVCPKRAGF
jgi:hypothetical protein